MREHCPEIASHRELYNTTTCQVTFEVARAVGKYISTTVKLCFNLIQYRGSFFCVCLKRIIN